MTTEHERKTDEQYEVEIKEYARKVADWVRLKESGQLDPEMTFPAHPSPYWPF